MRITTGKVVAGKVIVEDDPLPEGSVVTVLAPEAGETFELDAIQETELLKAVSEVKEGLFVDGEALLRSLPPST